MKRLLLGLALAAAVFAVTALVFVAAVRRTPLPDHPGNRQPESVDLAAFERGEIQFPGARWEAVDPEVLGWSAAGLEDARRYAEGLDTSAVFVVHRGVLVAEWGDSGGRYLGQSIRKSLLSALFGRLVERGALGLDSSLADLGIDDTPGLTTAERQATVRHLLLSRSGIYRSALYETPGWKGRKPDPGSHAPGEAWFYNNWSFNALGTVVERAAGRPVGEIFDEWIAEPLEMEDFRVSDVGYIDRRDPSERALGNDSDHPAYMFHVSARDLARFGLLYAADGRWDGRRVLPAGWVEESTWAAAQPTGWGERQYAYSWWVMPPAPPFRESVLVARGGRGHRMVIAPELDLVVVHRVPSRGVGLASQLFRRFVWAPSVEDAAIDEMLARIVAAHPERQGAAAGP